MILDVLIGHACALVVGSLRWCSLPAVDHVGHKGCMATWHDQIVRGLTLVRAIARDDFVGSAIHQWFQACTLRAA